MERTQDSILYIETDIRPGITCRDWRREHAPQAGTRRSFIGRIRARRAAKSR
jgi:hypothetical protein